MAKTKNCTTCDLDRRKFLGKVGKSGLALGFMGLSLQSRMFMREAYGVEPTDAKYDAAIQIFFSGGPSQTDTWDPKPGSQNNVFGTIDLGVNDVYGDTIRISNVFNNLADLVMNDPMVGLGLFRSMVHRNNNHGTAQGYMNSFWEGALANMYPSTASTMAYYYQGTGLGIPSVLINGANGNGANTARASRCPTALQVTAGGGAGGNPIVEALELPDGVNQARYQRRKSLLDKLNDRYMANRPDDVLAAAKRAADDAAAVTMQGDAADAFDLAGVQMVPARDNNTARRLTQAVRLSMAGIPYVAVGIGGNDSHNNNRQTIEGNWGNSVDNGVVEMVNRIKATGKKVLILMGGEFGRTPNTVRNGRNGRDHWGDGFSWAAISVNQPQFRTNAYGSTGPEGMYRESQGDLVDPVHPKDLGAFVYRSLGFQTGLDVEFDIPLNDREAPAVDRMNKGQELLQTFGLV